MLIQPTILFAIMMGFSLNALAQVIPSGLSFMGLNQNQWLIYVEKSGIFTELPAISEPRNPSFNYKSQKYAYIGSDASLHEASYLDSADSILKLAGKGHAYTQPAYDEDGKRLFLVSLKEGASVDTDILVRENGQWKIAVNQRSAQFEPYFQPPNTLYYSNVHCTEDCGRIIQEIWRKDLTSGIAEQVTLTNSIARQPVVSKDGETLYFSSNKAGYYHIWQLSLASNTYRQLTSGAVTDESPALDSEGHLYFIRHSADGRGGIMQWQDGAEPIELTLPEGVTDVRDLKIRQ